MEESTSSNKKWLTAMAVFCMCILVVTVILGIVWFMNKEDEDTVEEATTSTSTSTSMSTSTKKRCKDTNLMIDPDEDCETEYEKLVCPNTQCRPEETKRMCYCLLSPEELSTLPFLGKTYIFGNRKITIKADGEVLVQDGIMNKCFKSYVTKSTTIDGKTRYGLSSSGYFEDGVMYIMSATGGDIASPELTDYTFKPRSDCVNSLRWE